MEGSIAARIRRRRLLFFARMVAEANMPVRILDVGGTPAFWDCALPHLPSATHVTLLNLSVVAHSAKPNLSCVRGDARDLSQFEPRSFDICFSNSLLEHFCTFNEQMTVAEEIRRVARGYFVQTPNRYFPIEPHFLVPGWQFLPASLRARLVQRMELGWMPRARDSAEARALVASIRLLTRRELRVLFPDASIYSERIGGLTKSLIACRPVF
jgi:hypothetical protein